MNPDYIPSAGEFQPLGRGPVDLFGGLEKLLFLC